MVKLQLVKDLITPDLTKAQKELTQIPEGAYKIFRSHTPIRTGNARRKTILNKTTIEANYPYAVPLDKGKSNQAPDGMTKPTEDWIRKNVNRILKGR